MQSVERVSARGEERAEEGGRRSPFEPKREGGQAEREGLVRDSRVGESLGPKELKLCQICNVYRVQLQLSETKVVLTSETWSGQNVPRHRIHVRAILADYQVPKPETLFELQPRAL